MENLLPEDRNMSRKTAIHITNAEARAAEYRADARKDSRIDRPLTTRELLASLREARDVIAPAELLKRAADAAALSMRGGMYSAEDRKDCAAEIVWSTLAGTPGGAMPTRTDKRADLATLRGRAQNFRRSLDRKRATDAAADEERRSQRRTNWTEQLDLIGLDMVAERAADAREAATEAADYAVRALQLPPGGAVWTLFYQWARNAEPADCARDLNLNASTYRTRIESGARMLRALYPTPGGTDGRDLIEDLTGGAARMTVSRSGHLIYSLADERVGADKRAERAANLGWTARDGRVGTDAGSAPERPTSREDARLACHLRHQCPTPGLSAIGRALVRRGYWRAAEVSASGQRMYWRTTPRSALQIVADQRRASIRASIGSKTPREKSVVYSPRG